ncbi:MAG: hypothetical protein GY765_04035, partial [bacterium]|nr:hypothetical protein [bacterium]
IFFIPSGLNYFIYSNAENIESEGIEKATFDILMKFEKEMKEKIGTPNESNKHLFVAPIKAYLEKEFKQIQALEKKLETGMKKNIIAYQRLAMWLPSTFYLSAGNEISSKGYGNFIKFYKHIRVLKKQFVLYIVAKGYAGASATVAKRFLDSFFKKNEGIFKAEPGLPAYFLWGILLMVFYISGLTTLSYHCFKKALCL